MTPYELLDLALSLSNRLDTHWTLFISVHLALIGGIIYVDRPLTKNEKIAAMAVYTGFAVINYVMMRNQAFFLGSIYQQIDSIKNDACCMGNHAINYIVSLYQKEATNTQMIGIIVIHVAMYILILLSIFYDKATTSLDKSN